MQLFSVNAITSGTDSQGEVTVRLQKSGRIVNGNGADTDIVVASAKAYLSALNKLHSKLERAHPQVLGKALPGNTALVVARGEYCLDNGALSSFLNPIR